MKICYFGIFDPQFSRNRIYIRALEKEGYSVVLCRDNSRGILKYIRLWKKHRKIRNDYDFLIVGYPGHIVVPLAKFLSKKPVIADALGSLYDAEINSHNPTFLKRIKSFVADYLMVKFADKVILESFAQKKYFEVKFGKSNKYEVVYTGVDEKFINDRPLLLDNTGRFLVVFRGKLTPESGIMHILEASKILSNDKDIYWRIIGSGYFLDKVKEFLKDNIYSNVELISEYMPDDVLISRMKDASLLLGQFENNPRLGRTIPHKAFEAFALGIPYLTGDADAIKEIVEDGVNAFLVPLANPSALALKIRLLADKPKLISGAAFRSRQSFEEICSSKSLVRKIIGIMLQCQDAKN